MECRFTGSINLVAGVDRLVLYGRTDIVFFPGAKREV